MKSVIYTIRRIEVVLLMKDRIIVLEVLIDHLLNIMGMEMEFRKRSKIIINKVERRIMIMNHKEEGRCSSNRDK